MSGLSKFLIVIGIMLFSIGIACLDAMYKVRKENRKKAAKLIKEHQKK